MCFRFFLSSPRKTMPAIFSFATLMLGAGCDDGDAVISADLSAAESATPSYFGEVVDEELTEAEQLLLHRTGANEIEDANPPSTLRVYSEERTSERLQESPLAMPDHVVRVALPALSSRNYPGYVTTSANYDWSNRCATQPEYDIEHLTQKPNYVNAYRSGRSSCGVGAPYACPADTNCETSYWDPGPTMRRSSPQKHRQGIQRFRRGGSNYLMVSNSIERGYWESGEPTRNKRPGFEVIELGSESDTSLKLGANVTATSWPPCSDHIVKYQYYGNDTYDHAGGISIMGRFLAIPFEDSVGRQNNNTNPKARFRVYDMDTPSSPDLLYTVARERGSTKEKKNGSAVALTRLDNSYYLAMVWGADGDELEVFLSNEPYIADGFRSVYQEDMPGGFYAYQGIVFVTDCSGRLFVACTHKNSNSQDWIDLWRVTFTSTTSYNPTFEKVASRHLYCRDNATDGKLYCNFKAGAGTYVDGNGRVILYATEHFNDAYPLTGQSTGGGAYGVKFREFAPY